MYADLGKKVIAKIIMRTKQQIPLKFPQIPQLLSNCPRFSLGFGNFLIINLSSQSGISLDLATLSTG
jgi:hypothetical protein